MTRIAYLAGDGIGPEVLGVARRVLDAAGFEALWVDLPVGWDHWRRHGQALPDATLAEARRTDAVFLGAITSKPDAEAEAELAPHLRDQGLRYRSPILRLRHELGLHTNVRPVRSWPGVPGAARGRIDLVLFRQNTEGLYAGIEQHPFTARLRAAWAETGATGLPPAGPDTAVTLRVVTRQAVQRVAEAAFAHAERTGRRTVTLVEKANVLRATGGLVRRVFHEVGQRHPGIRRDELHIDAACALLVRRPERFDVVVATNLFGDILSDVAAEVAGGLALAPSANLGDRHALFEPVHGSAPDLAGGGVANPLGAVLAGAMMARHVGQSEVAHRVEAAVEATLADGTVRTPDLGGSATSRQVETVLTERVAQALGAHGAPPRPGVTRRRRAARSRSSAPSSGRGP